MSIAGVYRTSTKEEKTKVIDTSEIQLEEAKNFKAWSEYLSMIQTKHILACLYERRKSIHEFVSKSMYSGIEMNSYIQARLIEEETINKVIVLIEKGTVLWETR